MFIALQTNSDVPGEIIPELTIDAQDLFEENQTHTLHRCSALIGSNPLKSVFFKENE